MVLTKLFAVLGRGKEAPASNVNSEEFPQKRDLDSIWNDFNDHLAYAVDSMGTGFYEDAQGHLEQSRKFMFEMGTEFPKALEVQLAKGIYVRQKKRFNELYPKRIEQTASN